jgi:hypothetical protein
VKNVDKIYIIGQQDSYFMSVWHECKSDKPCKSNFWSRAYGLDVVASNDFGANSKSLSSINGKSKRELALCTAGRIHHCTMNANGMTIVVLKLAADDSDDDDDDDDVRTHKDSQEPSTIRERGFRWAYEWRTEVPSWLAGFGRAEAEQC